MDSETEATAGTPVGGGLDNPWFIGGMTDGIQPSVKGKNAGKAYAVGVMLEGYYDLARTGVWMAAAIRIAGSLALISWIVTRYLQKVGRWGK